MTTLSLFAAPTTCLPLNYYSPKLNFAKINADIGNHGRPVKLTRVRALNAVSDPSNAQVTWEIVIGTLAGVTPFVVAAVEFNKRIVAQRRCTVCKGSGLVLRDNKYYFRCPRCGGFLPWQSWKRFFSG